MRLLALLLPALAAAQVVPVTVPILDLAAINRNFTYLDASKMSYMGAWSATVTYRPHMLVTYNGEAFISTQADNRGRAPDAQTFWWHALTIRKGLPTIPPADANPAGATCPVTGAQAIYAKRLWICLAAGLLWEQVLTSNGQGVGALELQMGTPRWNPAVGSMLVFIDAGGVLRQRDANGRVRAIR